MRNKKHICHLHELSIFIVSPDNTCNVEIVFKRDIRDGKYDYYTFGQFSSGEQYLPQTVIQDDTVQPFTVVNATAAGQRGAYDLSNGYSLLPFKITPCYTKAKGQASSFIVKAFQRGQGPTNAKPIWTSDPFSVIKNHIAPMGGGVNRLSATNKGGKITVQWITDATDIAGFFVIVGESGSTKLYSKFISDPAARSADIPIAGNGNTFAATVNLQDKEGAVVNPTSCSQVAVQSS